MDFRERREELEKLIVSPRGIQAAHSRGRDKPEEPCSLRTCFQRDIDRITHSKSFRRLKHKTQVFLQPEGDHYRTRLTHTLEVSRIARTIARALELNEDLTEAIALGHDLGHTPFGHAGERALNVLMEDEGGFRHYEQSLRVIDVIEKEGQGLNLTYEVRDGILRHTNDPLAATLEGQTVRLADRVAYLNHDLDDAIRAGILDESDVPREITTAMGAAHSERIDAVIHSIIDSSTRGDRVQIGPELYFIVESLNEFMYQNVYMNRKAKGEEDKVHGILEGIFAYYLKNPEKLPPEYRVFAERDGLRRAVCDYVSGMTDKYAVFQFGEIFIPSAWAVM